MRENRLRSDYGSALRLGFEYLLEKYPEVFVIGQGLWSPWYVGNSMTDLDKKFGTSRVIDTPVSESACTGLAVGSAVAGMRPVVVHPRMDFLLYGIDAVVNQAAKWSYMFGGQSSAGVTVRAIINRGGEQGAQHSQALHSWFSHIPGLRVVMPYSVSDARDLLIASVLCDDPVIFIDDRWLYDLTDEISPIKEIQLTTVAPLIISPGSDITIAASGYSVHLALEAKKVLKNSNIDAEIVDLRVLNPYNHLTVSESVLRTGRLLVIDGGWANSGFAGEVIASAVENISMAHFKSNPRRITLPPTPAPSAKSLEKGYYPTPEDIIKTIIEMMK